MPTRSQVRTWIAVIGLLAPSAPSVASAQDRTERDIVELIVREGPHARAIRAEAEVTRREQLARLAYPNPSVTWSREGAGFTEFLQAEQPLPIFGVRASLARAGVAATAAAEADRDVRLWALRSEASAAVARLAAEQERITTAAAQVAEIERLIEILRTREREGEGSRFDRLRAEQELRDARQQATAASAAAAEARATLTGMLPPGIVLARITPSSEPVPPSPVAPSAVAQAAAAQPAVARSAVAPPAVTPSATPSAIAPSAMAQSVIPPPAVTPSAVPQSAASQPVVAPSTVAPSAVAPSAGPQAGERQPAGPLADVEALVARATHARAELRALHQSAQRAVAEAEAARRGRLPAPTVFGGLKRADDDAGRERGGVFGVTVGIPLFDSGGREAARWSAEGARVAAEREAIERRIHGEVAGAVEVLTLRQVAVAQEQPDAASELARIAEVAYREGEVGILELLDAVRTASQARNRAIDVRLDARLARIALERVVGEPLWS